MMGSLALVVAFIILSFWAAAGLSVILSLLGFRLAGAVFGTLSAIAGVWLLVTLPHAPFLGLINLGCGAFAVRRYFSRSDK